MTDKRKQTKAIKELEETKLLVDYLLHHGLSFDELENFSDSMIRQAKAWYEDGRDSD